MTFVSIQFNGEPKTEEFDESAEKVQQTSSTQHEQQPQSAAAQNQTQTSNQANDDSDNDKEILMTVLVPNAVQSNQNQSKANNNNSNNVSGDQRTSPINQQILWLPKIPSQSQQDGHQGPPILTQSATPQSSPIFRKQLTYSQVVFI